MNRATADVVVIGAGIVGLSVAHQLRRRSLLDVLVVDKAANVAEGSTGASSAILRHRYSHDAAIQLARDGIKAFRAWSEFTGLRDPRSTARPCGVLWMMGDTPSQVDGWVSRLGRLGIDAEALSASVVRERFPTMSACGGSFDLTGAVEHECSDAEAFLFEPGGGYADPVGAAQDLRDALRNAGVEIAFGTEVIGIRTAGGRVLGVEFADGSSVDTPFVVNAAGPWATRIAASAGLDLGWPLVPTRVQVVYRASVDEGVEALPVVADASTGVYFRPEGRSQILIGSVREEDEREEADPDAYLRSVAGEFRDRMLAGLHHRLPGLVPRGTITGLAGIYTVNRADVHPIIGATDLDGFLVANGFSGHGFKEAPAVGSLIARLITDEVDDFDTDAPIDFFSIGRAPITLEDKGVLA